VCGVKLAVARAYSSMSSGGGGDGGGTVLANKI
jgi:hypothetical protein